MDLSRRHFLTSAAAATVGAAVVGLPEVAGATGKIPKDEIAQLFEKLPGTVAFKIVAPATRRKRELEVSSNSANRLFIGSAFKTFVLGEELRQADSPDVVQTITERQLALDESVWSPDSATFNPPNLAGMVTERTAIEAMILHSDNTGADMCLKQVGTDNVRAFIASAGLANTLIPESTRSFTGYLLGAPDYLTFTWQQYLDSANNVVNPPLNTTQTMASSADDLVSYYSRALQGEFFQNDQTLNEFRAILSLGDVIWLLPVPLGVSAFAKGGEIDVPGFHALCAAGGMFFDDVWVYFCFTINWTAPEQSDPTTAAAWVAASSRALQLVKDALAR